MSTENPESYPQAVEYSESFKMTVVAEVISGQISQNAAQKKYGIGGKLYNLEVDKKVRHQQRNKENN